MALTDRTILHVDMNAFYASVECRCHPEIRHLPVVVGGNEAKRHGIVLAKNELAKKTGIVTGETLRAARQKCSNLCVVPPRHALYARYSRQAREIYDSYTPLVEPFGIDEAWLDVSGSDGAELADVIRRRIRDELGLTVSVGVSWCKVFAKLGSDLKKPDAVTLINRGNFQQTVWPLPVEALIYIGRSTCRRLRQLGVRRIGELAALPQDFLLHYLGKTGPMLGRFANGLDEAPVIRTDQLGPPKSIGNSLTAACDLHSAREVKAVLFSLCDGVASRLRESGMNASGLSVSVRNSQLVWRQCQGRLSNPCRLSAELMKAAWVLFTQEFSQSEAIRSLGVRAFALSPSTGEQLSLLESEVWRRKNLSLDLAMDTIRERYGQQAVRRAVSLCDPLEQHTDRNSGIGKSG